MALMLASTKGSYLFDNIGVYASQQDDSIILSYFISPDQEKVLVHEGASSSKADKYWSFLVAPDGSVITELPTEIRLITNGNWSPDSQMFLYQPYTQPGRNIVLFNINTMELTIIDGAFLGKDFSIEILWIPHLEG